ncbi:MAG TPA: Sec-independent protein translocase protein TatB [Candidatus Competibacteraceae bacterium]|nr:Sec-independent protein translocase protein TatB [Candidatus Competibacteraceae bacterium]
MFEVGFWELFLIAIIALIVVGPERLPGLARTAGLWIGKMRQLVAGVRAEVERELHMAELQQTLRQNPVNEELKQLAAELKSNVDEAIPPYASRAEAMEALAKELTGQGESATPAAAQPPAATGPVAAAGEPAAVPSSDTRTS